MTARPCGCPVASAPVVTVVDDVRHAEWHQQIAPLLRADAATLQATYGRPSSPSRTFVDEQFEVARSAVAS